MGNYCCCAPNEVGEAKMEVKNNIRQNKAYVDKYSTVVSSGQIDEVKRPPIEEIDESELQFKENLELGNGQVYTG